MSEFSRLLNELVSAAQSQILDAPLTDERYRRAMDAVTLFHEMSGKKEVSAMCKSSPVPPEGTSTPRCQRCGRTIPKNRGTSDWCSKKCYYMQEKADRESMNLEREIQANAD